MKRGELKEKIISGIQQIGIGVHNLREAWKWYHDHFGIDVRIFEENAIAELMLPYTGGQPQKRHAALALNLQGGGGFEIWQYTERTPQPPKQKVLLGDLGINAAKIKSKDINATHAFFKSRGQDVKELVEDPAGNKHFFVKDPFDNLFQVVHGNGWFRNEKKLTGATYGAIIGVSDIDKAREFYSGILGYDAVVYDDEGKFNDLQHISGGDNVFRRILLKHSKSLRGYFSKLFGPSQIELLQVKDRKPLKIYEGRQWGDLGFIHLCYDVTGMDALRNECQQKGYPFKVDSTQHHEVSFDMGEAAGQFSYVEDPDGTLIEFVETHKIPVIKKLGWYINLRKRNPEKALPNWMLKSLKFNRIKKH
ncbi:MAG: glyoxalase [Bacteroides sp. SM23_62_1]|nr:MAG: glyoxalase [Bacteroides sp. SM23_62_1]